MDNISATMNNHRRPSIAEDITAHDLDVVDADSDHDVSHDPATNIRTVQYLDACWGDMPLEGRMILRNPSNFRGLQTLRLDALDTINTKQLMQLLNLVTVCDVTTLRVALCKWNILNHTPDQISSLLPLRLEYLELFEKQNNPFISWRPVMQWLLGKRPVCVVKDATIVWRSLDIVPLLDLLRKTVPNMRRLELVLHSFESWDCSKSGRLWEQALPMDTAYRLAIGSLEARPFCNSNVAEIDATLHWTPLAIAVMQAICQTINPSIEWVWLAIRIRDLDDVDWAALDSLFGELDKALRCVRAPDLYYDVWIQAADPHGRLIDDDGLKRVLQNSLPRLYNSLAKPRVRGLLLPATYVWEMVDRTYEQFGLSDP
ncbi:uncharacterized protein C8Q71DRAFT_858179 [Rhodofomes roseus]|uniref:Uncharacterized protein n=1 Tax=Rhodofomes roseus TaxID=34475 RepID=A0ABQ8KEK0_9APHY|nr:uncharacterized protein C8Q71DRAFT_858179 [Rhodofomes roseus]KAH9836173.1 hypothetical protein C8Q71DRAFT_858179 [Rhodofomes roseus]